MAWMKESLRGWTPGFGGSSTRPAASDAVGAPRRGRAGRRRRQERGDVRAPEVEQIAQGWTPDIDQDGSIGSSALLARCADRVDVVVPGTSSRGGRSTGRPARPRPSRRRGPGSRPTSTSVVPIGRSRGRPSGRGACSAPSAARRRVDSHVPSARSRQGSAAAYRRHTASRGARVRLVDDGLALSSALPFAAPRGRSVTRGVPSNTVARMLLARGLPASSPARSGSPGHSAPGCSPISAPTWSRSSRPSGGDVTRGWDTIAGGLSSASCG